MREERGVTRLQHHPCRVENVSYMVEVMVGDGAIMRCHSLDEVRQSLGVDLKVVDEAAEHEEVVADLLHLVDI